MQKFFDTIRLPFTQHLPLFVILFLLFTANSVYLYTAVYHTYPYACFLAMHGFVMAYIVALLLALTPKYARKISTFIIMVLGMLLFVLDFYCINQLQTTFDADFATLLMATNPQEATEFIQALVPQSFVITVAVIFGLLAGGFYLLKKIHINSKWATIPLCLVLISIAAFVHNPAVWRHGIAGKIAAIAAYDVPTNVSEYYKHPSIACNGVSPKNIVVIMGESLSRHHCSLYGYEKDTNPLLGKLLQDSSLIMFADARSAGLSTMISFEYMMSGYSPEVAGKDKKMV
ncbi:MAG: sulfatase-like hydrolase/transferase [Muribaculaceae bacterium]|nr:sulfatase-like hydrolase/transferase [Muribaculaceae bacterium]